MRRRAIACVIATTLLQAAAAETRATSPKAQARLEREIRRELITLPFYGSVRPPGFPCERLSCDAGRVRLPATNVLLTRFLLTQHLNNVPVGS